MSAPIPGGRRAEPISNKIQRYVRACDQTPWEKHRDEPVHITTKGLFSAVARKLTEAVYYKK